MWEVWRPVVGDSSYYEVSNLGRVRSWHQRGPGKGRASKPRIMQPQCGAGGYLRLVLSTPQGKRGVLVHGLVANAFLGPRPSGMEVCHNDGNPTNNRVENLRYDTPKANRADKRRHGTDGRGERNACAKLTAEQVEFCRDYYIPRDPEFGTTALGQRFGVNASTIGYAIHGKSWGHL